MFKKMIVLVPCLAYKGSEIDTTFRRDVLMDVENNNLHNAELEDVNENKTA